MKHLNFSVDDSFADRKKEIDYLSARKITWSELVRIGIDAVEKQLKPAKKAAK
jgi:hypothetical protein